MGWAAPLDECDEFRPPSQHPERRRIHATTLVYGDGADITVMRTADQEPQLLRGAIGEVNDRLQSCWSARREAS
jgi:hypothetical protein